MSTYKNNKYYIAKPLPSLSGRDKGFINGWLFVKEGAELDTLYPESTQNLEEAMVYTNKKKAIKDLKYNGLFRPSGYTVVEHTCENETGFVEINDL